MKAISIKQPWADEIRRGVKTCEYRTWETKHRGALLIVASANPDIPGLPCGRAVCAVDLVSIRRLKSGIYSWQLRNPRAVEARRITGRLGLFNVHMRLS